MDKKGEKGMDRFRGGWGRQGPQIKFVQGSPSKCDANLRVQQ